VAHDSTAVMPAWINIRAPVCLWIGIVENEFWVFLCGWEWFRCANDMDGIGCSNGDLVISFNKSIVTFGNLTR
jgi:hypothetical protein